MILERFMIVKISLIHSKTILKLAMFKQEVSKACVKEDINRWEWKSVYDRYPYSTTLKVKQFNPFVKQSLIYLSH